MQLATENLVTQMEQINETVKKITDSLLFKLATTVGILTTIQQTFKRIIGPYFADVFSPFYSEGGCSEKAFNVLL